MKFADSMPRDQVILGVAEMVRNKYTVIAGACELMAKDLCNELRKRNVRCTHAVGLFRLDEPDAEKYVYYDDEEGRDEYEVEHDWVEVEGKILDISASQFRKSVDGEIPDIVFINHTSPLYQRYYYLNDHA